MLLRLVVLLGWWLLVMLWLLSVVRIRWRRLPIVRWWRGARRAPRVLLLLLLHRHHHSGLHHRLLLGGDPARHGVVPQHRIVVLLMLHRRDHRIEISRGHPVLPKLAAELCARGRNPAVLSLVVGGVGRWVLRMVGVLLVWVSLVRHGGRCCTGR